MSFMEIGKIALGPQADMIYNIVEITPPESSEAN